MARPAVLSAVAAAVLAACGGSGGDAADTTPPTITIVGPVAGETYATATVLLRALVSDDRGLASVEYDVDGGGRAPLPAANGGHELAVPLPLEDGAPLHLEVIARDRAGNTALATRSIRVDRVAPAVTLSGEDAACPDACTGTVLRASDGPLHLTGTARDGSGLASGVLVVVTDAGGVEVASASVAVDGDGAFDWSWDPWSAGSFFTIRARADDPKGNAGTAARVAYVDRVAPSIASGPAAVGAPRSGPLVSFSEPMATASVEAVTTLSVHAAGGQVPADAALAWSGARAFGFTPPLAPFTEYELRVAAGATDRAGNPLSPVSFRFETELVPPPEGPVVVASGARRPRIGVFRDGRPVVIYGTGASPRWVRWDGRGAWLDEAIPLAALSGGVAADLDTSLGTRRVSALFSVPAGAAAADLYFSEGDEPAWSGFPPDLVASTTLAGWSPALGVECIVALDCHLTALFGDAGGARYVVRRPAGWSAPNLVRSTGAGAAARGAGNAFLDDRVYYLDTRLRPPFFEAVTNAVTGVGRLVGAEDWRLSDVFYRARPVVLYTTPRAGSPAADDLTLACDSATPWRSAVTPLATTADDLALAVSSTTAAVAVALGDGTILFGTAPNGADVCLADPPPPTWDPRGPVGDAREPAVALGPDGAAVWKAWVRASTGELVVAR